MIQLMNMSERQMIRPSCFWIIYGRMDTKSMVLVEAWKKGGIVNDPRDIV